VTLTWLAQIFQTPAVPAQPVARAVSFSKEVATIAKIDTDDQKYSGVNDSFDFKLTIFYNRSGLPHEGYMTAFPTMLKGLAQAHYYNCSLSNKPDAALCSHAELLRRTRVLPKLTEWNAVTLQSVINENPEKSVSQ
jgi:hypothetical protein